MPIIIHLNSRQEPIVARGERLGPWLRFLLMLGLPLTVKALASDDVLDVPAKSIAYIQVFSDNELMRRQAAHEAWQAAERKKNPNPGPQPRLVVPR